MTHSAFYCVITSQTSDSLIRQLQAQVAQLQADFASGTQNLQDQHGQAVLEAQVRLGLCCL